MLSDCPGSHSWLADLTICMTNIVPLRGHSPLTWNSQLPGVMQDKFRHLKIVRPFFLGGAGICLSAICTPLIQVCWLGLGSVYGSATVGGCHGLNPPHGSH